MGDYFSPVVCEGLVSTNWRPTYVLEVPQRREDLRFGDARNRHNIKWAVKKAEQNGISVRTAENESQLIAWYPLYLQVMRRNFLPPRSLRLFAAIWRNLASQGMMRLQIAEQKQGVRTRLVSGSIFLTFGETTFYAFTGIADTDLSSHANDLILWRAINDACGTGVRRFWLKMKFLKLRTKVGSAIKRTFPHPEAVYHPGMFGLRQVPADVCICAFVSAQSSIVLGPRHSVPVAAGRYRSKVPRGQDPASISKGGNQ